MGEYWKASEHVPAFEGFAIRVVNPVKPCTAGGVCRPSLAFVDLEWTSSGLHGFDHQR
jgi:hypothetical protein